MPHPREKKAWHTLLSMPWKGHRKEHAKKTRIENAPRGLHVTRSRIAPFSLEISGFFQGSICERRSLAPLRLWSRRQFRLDRFCHPERSFIRNSPPAVRWAPRGFKGFLPSNDGYDSKNGGSASMARARPNWHTVSGTQCQNANSAPHLQTR